MPNEHTIKEVISSYDFCIAALEGERETLNQQIVLLKEHRAKLFTPAGADERTWVCGGCHVRLSYEETQSHKCR